MTIDRRHFVASLAAAVLAGRATPPRAGEARPQGFVGARFDAAGRGSVAVFDLDGREILALPLSGRGHDVALQPNGRHMVVFARRPGTWAAVIDRDAQAVVHVITPPQGVVFAGHGFYSEDGRTLFATEERAGGAEGVVSRHLVAEGYRRVDAVPSLGIGPHDATLLPGGRGMAIANGGLVPDPATGRGIINLATMRSDLVVIGRDGTVGERFALGEDLRAASIRHMAVAADGTIGFGCQWQGEAEAAPPLVGLALADGRVELLDCPESVTLRFDNYIGSVGFDASGTILAATSPRGGVIAYWDAPSRRFLGARRLPDVCGVAPHPETALFVVTSGNAGVRLSGPGRADLQRLGGSALDEWAWDNHLRVA
jgi:hypothetical protein